MEKKLVFIIIILFLVNLISAINLNVSEKPIADTIIAELDRPAIFEFTITNFGESDYFELYSVVGLEIFPVEPIFIAAGGKKTLMVEIKLQDSLKSQSGIRIFEYKIKDSKNEVQKEEISLNILKLEEAFVIIPENLNPKSKVSKITIKNKASYDLENVNLKIESAFFQYDDTFNIKALETKEIQIPIDENRLRSLTAGNFIMNLEIKIDDKKMKKEIIIKFLEQEDISTQETSEGFFINKKEVIKKNVGNVKKNVEIVLKKNILSYLFTTMNIEPSKVEFNGFSVNYLWTKELPPSEEMRVSVKTNWFFPIAIIIVIILIIYFIKNSIERDLVLRKKVSFVKTKGGQFALKISLKLKAKKFIQKINVIDKLPPLVKLYPKFGVIPPNKVDETNRRIEWNIDYLNKDEERIFSYIIYSKIGVVGKFELPSARATYEKNNKIKTAESNRSFYINEPSQYKEEFD